VCVQIARCLIEKVRDDLKIHYDCFELTFVV
jgi:hypothetical protein